MSDKKLNNITNDVEQSCLIDMLDEDCLSILFSFIPTTQLLVTEQVCNKWKNASLLTWKVKKKFISIYDENLSCQENLLNQQNIEVILSRWGSQLTHLQLIKTCQANILPVIVKNCQQLVDVVLEFDSVDQCVIQNDTSTLTKLESVDLKYVLNQFSTSNLNFIIQFFQAIPEGIDKLKISAKNDPCFESPEFLTVFEKYNAISHLTLNNCQLTDNVVKEIPLKKNIIYLDLTHSIITNGYSLANLVNLEHLNLSHVTGITEDLMEHILTNCKTIINLNIEFCQDITDKSLKNLRHLKNLEYLNVSCIEKLTGEFMIQLAVNCKNLKHLNLFNCFYVDKYNFGELGKMKNLEYLNFTVNNCNIDEYPIISIANNCHKLTHLGIISTNKCINITQRAFTKLEQLVNLKELHIVKMFNARDCLFTNMLSLRILNCSDCVKITDTGIIKVIKTCHKLESLNIFGTKVTTKSLVRAVELTKIRTNGIYLKIITNPSLLEEFKTSDFYKKNTNHHKFISPFLIIECQFLI